MTASHHIRRVALMAVLTWALLIGTSSVALARPIDDPALPTARSASTTAAPHIAAPHDGSDWTLPLLATGVIGLSVAATVGYAYRVRAAHRAVA